MPQQFLSLLDVPMPQFGHNIDSESADIAGFDQRFGSV